MHIHKKTRTDQQHHRSDLVRLASTAMVEHGLEPKFSESVVEELANITMAAKETDPTIRDLKNLLWCSIDNDDSLDLDQLTVVELKANGETKLMVAVADVDALVKKDSLLDLHARYNTTSIYTSGRIFPMLPPLLSVVVNKDVALIKQLSLILLADSVPDSARPSPAVSSPGSVPPSAPGDAVSLLRRLAHGALKQRWPDHYGAALA